MRRTVELIQAPTAMQPGGYVKVAYSDRVEPKTSTVDVRAERHGTRWAIELGWSCPDPSTDASKDTDVFVDAAALLAPGAPGAPWVTMGTADLPVEGVLWRAGDENLVRITARGLGSVERSTAPEGWRVESAWADGRWTVRYDVDAWQALSRSGELGLAIWRGVEAERAGLKSVTPGWVSVEP